MARPIRETPVLKGEDAFREYVDGNYDSSADYWLFKLDGSIVDDGTNYFSREVINESGKEVPEKIEGSEFTGSRVAALVNAIGIENAEKMLGINWNNSDLFNKITLKDVGLTDEQIKTVQHSGEFNVKLTDEQKLQLIGEALMAQNGGSWDSTNKQWDTGSLKIPGLENNDSLGVIRDAKTGKYTFFTAGLDFTSEDNAFSVYDDGNGGYKDRNDVSYEDRDNTDVTFWMKNVFTGEYIAKEPFENAFTSIDNTNNPRQTLISEYFKMYLVDSNAWRKDTYGVNQVGVFNGALTMEGLMLDMLGKDRPGAKSTLYHPMSRFAGSENCFGPMADNKVSGSTNINGKKVDNWTNPNIPGSGAYYFQQQLNLYHSLGIYNGYQFNIHLKGKLR